MINNKGILQIADFGLARVYDEPVPQPGRGGGEARRDYTTLVVTRWYRPPELLLQLRRYTTAIDMWGVGCVFGEMFKGKPILAGNSDLNQAHLIFDLVGSPTEENMPGFSSLPGCEGVKNFEPRRGNLAQVFREQGPLVISLLSELLKLDWRKRINAIDALKHPYFTSEPLPARPEDLPYFEESHELDRRKYRGKKAALPPAPAGGTVGMGTNGEWVAGSGPPPPPAGPPNGGPYMNGTASRAPMIGGQGPYDRGVPNGAYPGPRGPPGRYERGPPNHYDHRGPGSRAPPGPSNRQAYQPPPRYNEPPSRQPHTYDEGLPDSNRRHPLEPPLRPPRGGPKVDTYIPAYSSAANGPPRPGYDQLSHPPGRGDRRPRGEPPTRREDRRDDRDYRDRDRPGADRRDYEGRDYSRRSRTRSPDRDDHRERNRDRDRELYRR